MTNLDATFAALADPTRRAILATLAGGERTVTELVEPSGLTQPAVSHHLRVLERAGLIVRRAESTRRPCRLAPAALGELEAWLSTLRRTFEASYDRLDAVLASLPPPAGSSRSKSKSKDSRRKR